MLALTKPFLQPQSLTELLLHAFPATPPLCSSKLAVAPISKHLVELEILVRSSFELLLSPTLFKTSENGIIEKHCCDDALKVKCMKE